MSTGAILMIFRHACALGWAGPGHLQFSPAAAKAPEEHYYRDLLRVSAAAPQDDQSGVFLWTRLGFPDSTGRRVPCDDPRFSCCWSQPV